MSHRVPFPLQRDIAAVAEANGIQNFRTLLDFSLGRIDAAGAMNAFAIDSEEDLFLLMAQAHLPKSRVPDSIT